MFGQTLSRRERTPQEFVIDLSEEEQPEQLGDLIVFPFSYEEVGPSTVSGIAFVKPCVSDDETLENICAAQVTDNKTIQFTLPKTNRVFSNKATAWKQALGKTWKLTETLSAFAPAPNDRKAVHYKISEDDDVELSNEYFTNGIYRLDRIIVPYEHSYQTGDKDYSTKENLLIWRVYFAGTERRVATTNKVNLMAEKLATLMGDNPTNSEQWLMDQLANLMMAKDNAEASSDA